MQDIPDHVGSSRSSMVHATHTGTSISKRQVAAEKAELTLTSSPRADEPAPTQNGGCTGGCCGNGIGCCGAAIAAACSSLPDFRDPQAPIPLVSHSSSGIDPDALRRPPRTLADVRSRLGASCRQHCAGAPRRLRGSVMQFRRSLPLITTLVMLRCRRNNRWLTKAMTTTQLRSRSRSRRCRAEAASESFELVAVARSGEVVIISTGSPRTSRCPMQLWWSRLRRAASGEPSADGTYRFAAPWANFRDAMISSRQSRRAATRMYSRLRWKSTGDASLAVCRFVRLGLRSG